MALPTMKWRYVGSSSYGANLPAALDAIYTLGTATRSLPDELTATGWNAQAAGEASGWRKFDRDVYDWYTTQVEN